MKTTTAILLIIFFSATAMAQSDVVLYSGEVINKNTGSPIQDVHILNKNNGVVSISDEDGFFSIQVFNHHVLQFSVIGFETKIVNIQNDENSRYLHTTVKLEPKIYALRPVTIQDMQKEVETVVRKPEENWKYGKYGLKLTGTGAPEKVGPTLENPISLLYDWFSREGKQKRKLEELLKEEKIAKAVAARYESDLIWEATGLYGEDLVRFKNFCNLPQSFILNSNDYDFLMAVKGCYIEYKRKSP